MEIFKFGKWSINFNDYKDGYYYCRIYRDKERKFTMKSTHKFDLDYILDMMILHRTAEEV